MSNFSSPVLEGVAAAGEVAGWASAETTGGAKPGRKRKAIKAKAPAETLQARGPVFPQGRAAAEDNSAVAGPDARRSEGPSPVSPGTGRNRTIQSRSPAQAGDAPFEFLTYQLDGRIVAYHGYNG